MQSELRSLASMYKQRLLNECGCLKRCNKQNELKHDTKHACDCNPYVQGSISAAPLRHTGLKIHMAHTKMLFARRVAHIFSVLGLAVFLFLKPATCF